MTIHIVTWLGEVVGASTRLQGAENIRIDFARRHAAKLGRTNDHRFIESIYDRQTKITDVVLADEA